MTGKTSDAEADRLFTELESLVTGHFDSVERDLQTAISLVMSEQSTIRDEANRDALAKIETLLAHVSPSTEPERPKLMAALPKWVEKRSKENLSAKKQVMDENRIRDFVSFAGDRPLNKYKFSDFQKYADLLVRVPVNYKKFPALKHMSFAEVADYNDALSGKKRYETLVDKSIQDNYLSPLKTFFLAMGVDHDFRSPLTDGTIRISAAAKEGIDRQPLQVADLNKWFAYSAQQKRSDEKWLPLLGALTGARIGELIYLQGKDIFRVESGAYIIDLTKGMLQRDGSTTKRKLKNKSSRRYIALHECLIKAGFIDYATSRHADEWIFPEAHRWAGTIVKHPADAASKRMNKQLKHVGVHRRLEVVFHSTRHSAKDFMRIAKVEKRTADMQTGHTFTDVADTYGSKQLRSDEIEYLAAMQLPEGLDLSPYSQPQVARDGQKGRFKL